MSEQKKVTIRIKSLPYNGRYGFVYRENTVQSVDEDEALELIDAGIADFHEGKTREFFVDSSEPTISSNEEIAAASLEAVQGENQDASAESDEVISLENVLSEASEGSEDSDGDENKDKDQSSEG